MDKNIAVNLLARQILAIDGLVGKNLNSPEFLVWKGDTAKVIRDLFPGDRIAVDRFKKISYSDEYGASFPSVFNRGLNEARLLLQSFIRDVEERDWLFVATTRSGEAVGGTRPTCSRVFIVHGHDEAAKHKVARCIEQLGLKAIVLDEQADKGRTVIEKFEDHSKDVWFAVVLFTPDDEGKSAKENRLKPRARQNVVFELGYFVGRLGRDRVCLLRKGGVEIPSDYTGVLYTPEDSDLKLKLAKEIKAAGIPIDANKVL